MTCYAAVVVAVAALIVGCSQNVEVRDTSMAASAAAGADSVVLERTVCFGRCPAYRLRIASNGMVLFQPQNPPGSPSTDSISAAAFRTLVSEFDRARFDSYPDVIQEDRVLCALVATDHPSSTITVFRAGGSKQVKDYTGCYAATGDTGTAARLGTLRKLDELVDSTARSARWVRPLDIGAARATPAQTASVEADHIFIYTSPGAKVEAEALRKLGFVVDTAVTRHTGQGSASRSVMLENGYIELIWIDTTDAVSADARAMFEGMRHSAAWRTSGASPFGLGLRASDGASDYGVPAKAYSAPWMKPGSSIALLKQDAERDALEMFVVPDYMAVPSWIDQVKEHFPALLAHPNGSKRITRIEIHGAAAHRPVAARRLTIPGFTMREAAAPVAIVELDGATRNVRSDLRPVLPLVLLR